MKTLHLKPVLSLDQANELAGEFLDERHYNTLVDEDADVFREDGTVLLKFRKDRITVHDASIALEALRGAALKTRNRGKASGNPELDNTPLGQRQQRIRTGKVSFQAIKRDGTISNTSSAVQVLSGIVGAFERSIRFPYCRQTYFTAENPDKMAMAMPFIHQVSEIFRQNSPQRYKAQKEVCDRTHPDYVFKGTPFSTITVNRNWRTACHQDAGDLKSGFGVLSVLSEGEYSGGYFIIPRYGVAVNMTHGDVLLADVHEYHGNSPLKGLSKFWTRISCVFYYRTKMIGCKSLEEELAQAKRRKAGDKVWHDFHGTFPK